MNAIIDFALHHSRTILSSLVLMVVAGTVSYIGLPKESDPNISLPVMYVRMSLEGISPEDSERLLLRPMEQELRSIEGIKEMKSIGYQGGGSVVLEFDAGFDAQKALDDVRNKVDIAKAELPDDADEPSVHEVNFSLFPVLIVSLSGNVPERTLQQLARDLRDKIEGIDSVLEAKISGNREDLVEMVIDPLRLESYGLNADDVGLLIGRSNRLVAAGTMDSAPGPLLHQCPRPVRERRRHPEHAAEGQRRCRCAHPRCSDAAPDLQGRGELRPHQRAPGRGAGSLEAHGREHHRHRGEDPRRGRSRARGAALAGADPGDLFGRPLERHQGHAQRTAEQPDIRHPAGHDRHHRRARLSRRHAGGRRHSVLLPDRHPGAGAVGPDHQCGRAVQPDPRRRHAGGWRDRAGGIRRPQDDRGPAEAGRLSRRRPRHGLADHQLAVGHHRRVPALDILAGRGRRVHEVFADHADGDAAGLAAGGYGVHAGAGLRFRQGAARRRSRRHADSGTRPCR